MPAKPSTGKCDKHNSMVNRHIGTAYDTVKIVADNIEIIEEIGDNLPYLLKYLGAYSTPPTERPDGSPLQDGDYYFDSVSEALVYYKLATDEWFEVDPQEILNARDEAIAARDAAQLAQANAETAEANAEASELAAAQSENNAATSASAAATSESNAASSESNAAGSAADALASENAALASELAAAQSEANASTSESNANLSAQAAATSEANALASETNAAGSAVAAAQSAADAEQAFDNFTDLYLGAHEEDPTTDNDGNPLQVGATYWNIPDTTLLYWSGVIWDSPEETAIQAANTAIAARDDAQISETNAEGFADDAELSATNAATSETNAANSASTAQSAATTAGNHATTAMNAASAASQSETNAAASELNALASENKAELWAEEDEDVEVEPNRYSAKHWASKAEQEAGVLTWQKHARTGTDLNQMREQNKDARAASGFDHYGQHRDAGANPQDGAPINEGMWAYTANSSGAHLLNMGICEALALRAGESKTLHPVIHMAGFTSELSHVGVDFEDQTVIKFDDAPDGTIIYDSTGNARGTGSPNLNLLTDVDPKYGDVAADHNEAVARAFEGGVLNGDFRNGTTNWGTNNATLSVTDGVATVTDAGSSAAATQSITEAGDYILTVSAFAPSSNSSTNAAALVIDGQTVQITQEDVWQTLTLTHTTTGARNVDLSVWGGANGDVAMFRNLSVRKVTEEVVIDRHDLFGGEFFLEEVSGSNPYVYPKGMIQSQATTMNGITTVATNRPDTYYAVYLGDTGSNGLGVDFWAATDAEKIDMVSDESNNLFLLEDGRLVQWRMRQRTVAGAKNGDWNNIDPTNSAATIVCGESTTGTWLAPQGNQDVGKAYSGGNVDVGTFQSRVSSVANEVNFTDNGTFKAYQNGYHTFAVDGECYFHVWGVVRRLNQGAYHPSFNPLGARKWRDAQSSTLNQSKDWFDIVNPLCKPTATAQAFNIQPTGVPAQVAASSASGYIGAPAGEGRDDDRFYDAIYAGGDGGVNDYRLSSWDMSSKEEASKVFQKVVDGTYRGEERVQFVGVIGDSLTSSYNVVANQVNVPRADIQLDRSGEFLDESDGNSQKASGYVSVNGTVHEIYEINYESAGQATMGIRSRTLGTVSTGATIDWVVVSFDSNSTVSGEFWMVDVIGDPAEILATPNLANGWQGGWSPQIPDATTWTPLTRKSLTSVTPYSWTDDNGATWGHDDNGTIDTINNRIGSVIVGRIIVTPYTAFAKQTVEANNTPVLNAYEGIGEVDAFLGYHPLYGVLFAESLMGKVCTANASGHANRSHGKPTNTYFIANGEIGEDSDRRPTHVPLYTIAPNNGSPAVKALWYQTANNQQVSLNFAWNELVYASSRVISDITNQNSATVTTNGVYRFTDASGTMLGNVVRRQGGNLSGSNLANLTVLPDGSVMDSSGTIASPQFWTAFTSNGWWGDDSTINITDGTGTYTNLNGETCLRGSATLSKPIGYSKNHARVGTQAGGVDL